MTERTYDWNGQYDIPISYPQLTDGEAAAEIRMLCRKQLDHEAFVVMARDRIMALSKENSVLESMLADRDALLSELERTVDGKYITAKTELWQIDPNRFIHDGHPWQAGPGWSFQRCSDLPVYSSAKAAEDSLRETESTERGEHAASDAD